MELEECWRTHGGILENTLSLKNVGKYREMEEYRREQDVGAIMEKENTGSKRNTGEHEA